MTVDGTDAPWNEVTLPDKEIEVTISVTLSKTVKIFVDNYKEDYDEECKCHTYDYSECNLHKAVEEQIVLPQNLAIFTERMFNQDLGLKAAGMPKYLKMAITKCKDWNVDEFEIIKE